MVVRHAYEYVYIHSKDYNMSYSNQTYIYSCKDWQRSSWDRDALSIHCLISSLLLSADCNAAIVLRWLAAHDWNDSW